MQRRGLSDLAVFILLVTISIMGRNERVDWNFTPIAAATIFAGYYFRRAWIAALLPIAALAVSDLREPIHGNMWVLLTVWGTFAATSVLGPWLRRAEGLPRQIGRGAAAALVPSTIFFLTTNLVVWATVDPLTLVNLGQRYALGIPFFGKMLAGDLFYMGLFFGAYALATMSESSRQPVTAR